MHLLFLTPLHLDALWRPVLDVAGAVDHRVVGPVPNITTTPITININTSHVPHRERETEKYHMDMKQFKLTLYYAQ